MIPEGTAYVVVTRWGGGHIVNMIVNLISVCLWRKGLQNTICSSWQQCLNRPMLKEKGISHDLKNKQGAHRKQLNAIDF